MNILLLVVIVMALISGCGYSKANIKAIVNETIEDRRETDIWHWDSATKEDLSNLEKKVKNQRRRSIDYHKKNWPHGCEASCK